MTIDDALARFLVQLEADGRSPHTTGLYRRHVRRPTVALRVRSLEQEKPGTYDKTVRRCIVSYGPLGLEGRKPTLS